MTIVSRKPVVLSPMIRNIVNKIVNLANKSTRPS